jgi:shikimate dehydrogenase
MDRVSERADLARAVNTIVFETDGTLFGDNTDGAGLVTDLKRNLGVGLEGSALLLLGAGGAARGVLGPLLGTGPASLVIANRTVDRAAALAGTFARLGPVQGSSFERLAGMTFDVVINATSASIDGQVPPVAATLFKPSALAYDMMYGDEPTVFVQWCTDRGVRAVDGLGMLVEQAAESFSLWHGVRPDTAAVLAELRGRS